MMNKIFPEKKSIQRLLVSLSLFFLSLVVFCALFAEFLMPYSLSDGSLSKSLCGISKEHLFGCDLYGVDLLSEIILGSRTSVLISLSVVSLTTLTGCIFGSFAAFFRGWWDTVFLQVTESFMALPGILIIIAKTCIKREIGYNISGLRKNRKSCVWRSRSILNFYFIKI